MGRKAAVKPDVVTAPFTVLVDSREREYAYTFQGIRANADRHSALIDVPTMVVALPMGGGDYGVLGHPGIAIERKTKSDLYGSIGQKRANFVERLELMSGRAYAAVVVEAEISELLGDPPPFTGFSPKSLVRTIQAWAIRYPTIHWWFLPGREAAERWTFRLLHWYWEGRGREEEG